MEAIKRGMMYQKKMTLVTRHGGFCSSVQFVLAFRPVVLLCICSMRIRMKIG